MKARYAFLLVLCVLALCSLACDDWDGMDRSGWTVTPAATEMVGPQEGEDWVDVFVEGQ